MGSKQGSVQRRGQNRIHSKPRQVVRRSVPSLTQAGRWQRQKNRTAGRATAHSRLLFRPFKEDTHDFYRLEITLAQAPIILCKVSLVNFFPAQFRSMGLSSGRSDLQAASPARGSLPSKNPFAEPAGQCRQTPRREVSWPLISCLLPQISSNELLSSHTGNALGAWAVSAFCRSAG
jgi:hypothetical protein